MIVFRNIKWKNFLSYGDHWTEVNLNQTKSSLIIGENGAGKSTILDALSFVLYNKPFRKVTVQQLVNSINNKHMEVEVEFTIGKNMYTVLRGQKPRVFEVWQNDKLLNQEAHAKDYQEVLEKTILKLNHKSFTQVVVLGSSSFVPFMQLATNHRKEVIEDLLDIGIFSVMGVLLKEKVSKNKELISESKNQHELIESKLTMQREYIDKIKSQQDEAIKEKKDKIEELKNENGILEQNIQDEEVTKLEYEKLLANEESTKQKLNKLNNLDDKIETKLRRLKKEIAFYENHDDCPTCNQSIDESFKHDCIETKKGQIDEVTSGVDKLTDEIKETQASIEQMAEYNSALNSIVKLINELNGDLNTNNALINSLEEDIQKSFKKDIKEETKKIDVLIEELHGAAKDL